MNVAIPKPNSVLDKKVKSTEYPNARIIVLDDNINTFENVAKSLIKIIPAMKEATAWAIASQVDKEGAAEVWRGPLEQAELYHQQLVSRGITMAPIERC